MQLILASSSPRRRELLERAGFRFGVHPASVAEEPCEGEAPEKFALRIAREKALRAAASSPPDSLVLGADTVVVIDGEILGKPGDPEEAARMLRRLSGRTHRVITGVCLVRAPDCVEALDHETTWVYFRQLDEQEIEECLSTAEPYDKAGAYGIQGLASKFVTRIEGCYFNVMGLPVALVSEMLKRCQ